MNNKQESHLSMAMAEMAYLAANSTITATLPNFATYFTPLQAEITQIQAIRELQEFDKTGITVSKSQFRTALISAAIDVGRRVVAYATNVNNAVLLAEVGYTESDLKKSPDTVLKDRCQVIYDRANANVAALATYGVTAATLPALLTAITNFNAAIPKPRIGIADKKQATDQLAVLFDTLDANFGKIDTLVEMVKVSQPNFYKEYRNLRKIIDTGAGSLVAQVKTTNAQTGEPLANVTVTLTPTNGLLKTASTNGQSKIVKKTAAGGGANIKSAPDGTYQVLATKPGFKDGPGIISIVNGELTILEIKLEKI